MRRARRARRVGQRSTVADAVVGLVKPTLGHDRDRRRPMPPGKVDAACEAGVGYVPQDRHARGFAPQLGVAENLTLALLGRLARRFGHRVFRGARCSRKASGRAAADRRAQPGAAGVEPQRRQPAEGRRRPRPGPRPVRAGGRQSRRSGSTSHRRRRCSTLSGARATRGWPCCSSRTTSKTCACARGWS